MSQLGGPLLYVLRGTYPTIPTEILAMNALPAVANRTTIARTRGFGIARLIEIVTGTQAMTVWPDLADRQRYANQRHGFANEWEELESHFALSLFDIEQLNLENQHCVRSNVRI